MEWDATSIVYITFEAITGFVTILGNSIVIVAIIRTQRLHTVTNVFIGNLAAADIVVGLIVAPLAALSFMGLPKDVYGCIFINCAILMFTNVSILMLLAVAAERFIAIRLPFLYKRILTIRRAMLLNGGIWILGFLLGLIPMYGWNIAPDDLTSCSFTGVISMQYMVYFQFFGLVVLPIAIMLCIYSYILYVIRKHAKRTDALQKRFSVNRQSGTQWMKEVRAAKSFALLIVLFAVFWLPVNIMNCFTLFCPSCYQPYQLLLAAIVMSHANSSINPVLYAASNSHIHRSIKALFSSKRGLNDSSGDIQSGKYNSGVRGGDTLARHGRVSVVSGNVYEGPRNCARISPFEISTRKSSPEDDNQNPPALRRLSPLSLVPSNDSSAYRLNNQMHVSKNAYDAQAVEATQVSNELDIGSSHELHPFSDAVPKNHNNHDKCDREHVSDNDQLTVLQQVIALPPTSSKTFLGHINLGYVDDKPNGSIPSLQFSPVKELYAECHCGETETFNGIMADHKSYQINDCPNGEHLVNSISNDKSEDQIINDEVEERTSVWKIIEAVQSVAETEAVEKEPPNIMRPSGVRSRLFEMEDEPSLEQDFYPFAFVISENDDDGDINRDTETAVENDQNIHKSIVHSYFQPQKDINGGILSDVEIRSQDVFTNIESFQTKL